MLPQNDPTVRTREDMQSRIQMLPGETSDEYLARYNRNSHLPRPTAPPATVVPKGDSRQYLAEQQRAREVAQREITEREALIASRTPQPPVNKYEQLTNPAVLAAGGVGKVGAKHVKGLVQDEQQRLETAAAAAAERARIDNDPDVQRERESAARVATHAAKTGNAALIKEANEVSELVKDGRPAAIEIAAERREQLTRKIVEHHQHVVDEIRQRRAAIDAELSSATSELPSE
jgi:hypothetical protein